MVDTSTSAGKAASTVALAAVVVGLSVLVGWLFDLDSLKRVVPGLIAMNPATAIAFVFAGLSLALFLRPPRGRNRTARAALVAARFGASAVALIGLAKIVAVLGGWENGVDQWLFASKLSEGLQLPNRMALNTALSFILLGSALLVVDVPHRSVRLGVEVSAVVIALGSLVAILAYAYDLPSHHGLVAFVRMALHTAITFLVLVAAILLAHTDGGLLAVFAGDSAAGRMARYLLPAAVLVPAALGLATRQGEAAGFYSRAFGEAGLAAGSILLFTFLICWIAQELFRADVRRHQDEHTLRESAAFLQAQVHSSLDGILVVDQAGKLVLQNQRFVEIFGIPRQIADQPADEARLRWVTDQTVHPEQFVNRVRHLYAHPDKVGRDEIELKNGTLLDRYSTPVIGQDGRRYGRLWVFRDITERKQSEESLRVQSAALEAAANGMVITDRQGTIQWVNRAFTTLTGYTSQDAVGQNPRVFKSGCHEEAFYRALWQTISAGQAWTGELTNRRKDGSLYVEDMTITPLRDAHGAVTRYIAIKQDVTQRKQAEAGLRESEARMRAITDSAQDAILMIDPAGRTTFWNPAAERILGYTKAEAMGQNLHDLIVPARFHAAHRAAFPLFVQTGQGAAIGKTLEMEARRKDGQEILTQLSISAVHMDDGWHAMGLVRDITERKRNRAELETLHQQLVDTSRQAGMAEVATNVLHNVGNVLNSVNISTGVLVETVKKSRASSLSRVVTLLQEHTHDLGTFIAQDARGQHLPAHLATLAEHLLAEQAAIVRELESLRQNVEHIKDIVAMQQSYAAFGAVRQTIDVASLVEDSLRMNEDAFSRHRVEVIREFEPVPPLLLEKHKLLQILVNLLSNAKFACDMAGRMDHRVTVRVANGDGRVRISVMDNGIGIPPENLTRVFNHGFTTRPGGHGFGLHSSALAAKELGGSLIAHSDGPGQGAVFTLDLPGPTREDSHA